MKAAIVEAVETGITHLAFGDLHLQEIRDYRGKLLEGSGLEPLFPIWGTAADSPKPARRMLAGGIEATLTCVDPAQLSETFLGRSFDAQLLDDLPLTADPCGEKGEFHTFRTNSPDFAQPIEVHRGEHVLRDGFWFADLRPGPAPRSQGDRESSE